MTMQQSSTPILLFGKSEVSAIKSPGMKPSTGIACKISRMGIISSTSAMHPRNKPLDLIRRLILNSTRIGDVVYDGFLGSGTTLLACEQTKRVCIGVELDPEYCQTIISRFEKLTGLKAERYE